jgi:hypothetical protein
MIRTILAGYAAAFVCLVVAPAHAQRSGEATESARGSWSDSVRGAVANGSFLPLSLSPRVGGVAAEAAGYGGYDSAESAGVMSSFAEARIYGPLAVRAGATLNDGGEELGPFIGGRVQLLTEADHGIDAGAAVFYKAEGFDEPEGELELVLSIGKRVGRTLLIGTLAYGQDPEGNERDGELRAAALFRLAPSLHLGVDAQGRFDLGSDREKLRKTNEPTYDLDAGPVLTCALGPIALMAHSGVSVVRRLEQPADVGVVALGGIGTAF